MRPLASLTALALLLPASGCCTMARLFCGPDTSPWVSVDFDTPRRTVQTLLEAFRRDDPDTVYDCLSQDFRKRQDLDGLTTKLVWQQLRDQNPGLHLAGYAQVPEPTSTRSGAQCVLEVEGSTIVLQLVRESRWDVRYRRADGTPGEMGKIRAAGDLHGLATVEVLDGDDDRSQISLAPMIFYHDGLDDVPLDAIEFAGIRRQWKIDSIAVRQ